MKRIPSPGKKWGIQKAADIAHLIQKEINKLDRAELEALIKTCEQFTETNCAWTSYHAKDVIVHLAKKTSLDNPCFQTNP
jgi:hypothetical protein